MEAEAVALAACSTLQLLQQEDDSIMDDTHHPRATHPAQRELLQVEAGTSLEDTINHCTPGNCDTEETRAGVLRQDSCQVVQFKADCKQAVLPSMLLA